MRGLFKDKVVAVTGGAQGIGRNIVQAFGQEGAQVVICDIDEKAARKTCAHLCDQGIDVEYLKVDLHRVKSAQAMVRSIVRTKKSLDILINNARFSRERTTLLTETESSWNQELEELKATFFVSQEAMRHMAKAGGGCILNVSSIAAVLTCHQSPAYHAAKAGSLQLTRYLAAEGGPLNVRVNAILPGFIVKDADKDCFESAANRVYRATAEFCHPLQRVGSADDVAQAAVFLCSPKAPFITGQCLTVDGGLTLQEQSGLVFRSKGKKKRKS